MVDRHDSNASRSSAFCDDHEDGPSIHASALDVMGVRSGEIFVQIAGDALCAPGGAAHGLSPAIRSLAIDRPTLQQMMAPWTHKIEYLQRRRQQLQERRRLVQARNDATRAAMDEIIRDPANLVAESQTSQCHGTAVSSLEQYGMVSERLQQSYSQYAMNGVLQYYALLEEERAHIAAWQHKESIACHEQIIATKRRHHLTSFAVHLESETMGQIRLWRLIDGDSQRARCVKAARENIKKGFFQNDTQEIDVTDVYKIANQPLLRAFEQHIAQTDAPKVKGLFCSVKVESLEHCVVWGMFENEETLAATTGSGDQPLFNRPKLSTSRGNEAPGTQRRFVAQQRVQEATAMTFPRRFSRYSTLRELHEVATSDATVAETPVRYLALCRVAMGKTQRVIGAIDTDSPLFPTNPSVGSLFLPDDEEYILRYPEAVVPEFLVEYRFIQQRPVYSLATTRDRLIPVNLTNRQRSTSLPSALFEVAANQALADLKQHSLAVRPQTISLLTEASTCLPVTHFNRTRPLATHDFKHQELPTENALEVCGHQRRLLQDDLEHMRRIVWETTHSAWEQLSVPIRPVRKEAFKENEHATQRKSEENASSKKQSLKAKKLYNELALERQLQAKDMARLDALVQPKLHKFKKKEGTKPRPFR